LINVEDTDLEKQEIKIVENLIRLDPDKCVFGNDILYCMEQGMLEYILCDYSYAEKIAEQSKVSGCKLIIIKYDSYLEQYDASIGILWVSGSNKHLQ